MEFRGKQIFFFDKGNGPALVFLHGYPFSHELWMGFIDKLVPDYRIICPDLPGFGNSESIGEEHSMDLMADGIASLLQYLKISKCVLTGHSMGGYVSLSFAEKYPEYLSGLCLFHSHPLADSEQKKREREITIQAVIKNHDSIIESMIPNLFAPENRGKYGEKIKQIVSLALKTSKQGIINALRGMKNRTDKQDVLKNIPVPVLWILGKNDELMKYDIISPMSKHSQQITLVTLENSGHMGMVEERNHCIIEFLRWIKSHSHICATA